MPQVALLDSLQLCKISGCLYTPYVQDRRYFASFIVDRLRTPQLQLRRDRQPSSFDVPFKILLGILGYWSLMI
jgi:hypothetical protein